jgi:hypothetical protein
MIMPTGRFGNIEYIPIVQLFVIVAAVNVLLEVDVCDKHYVFDAEIKGKFSQAY